jgi:hypothetical protein
MKDRPQKEPERDLDDWWFACDCGETFIDVVARSD